MRVCLLLVVVAVHLIRLGMHCIWIIMLGLWVHVVRTGRRDCKLCVDLLLLSAPEYIHPWPIGLEIELKHDTINGDYERNRIYK